MGDSRLNHVRCIATGYKGCVLLRSHICRLRGYFMSDCGHETHKEKTLVGV